MTVEATGNLAVSGIWPDLLVSRAQTIYYSAAGIEQWRAIPDAATEPSLPSNPIGVAVDGLETPASIQCLLAVQRPRQPSDWTKVPEPVRPDSRPVVTLVRPLPPLVA